MAIGVRMFGRLESIAALDTAGFLISEAYMRDVLEDIGKRVAEGSRERIGEFAGASMDTIVPRTLRSGRVAVFQNKRKVSGLRGDYGKLQMTHGLWPALEEQQDGLTRGMETAILKAAKVTGLG